MKHNIMYCMIFNILYYELCDVDIIHMKTGIDKWFLHQIFEIVLLYKVLESEQKSEVNNLQLNNNLIKKAKKN